MSGAAVLEVKDLHKTFRLGFFRKRVDAVRGIDFAVQPGEVFGLLGPNGAGKTTTIKMVLRLIFPTRGSIALFGEPVGARATLARVGYLPENPYVYQYLKVREFLDLCGRLVGMGAADRRKRTTEMIERVGLAFAADRPIGKFSKGMMQRVGLAQALLHDPEFLILDEPMSGLDPIGRREVSDLLVEQRARGKTLLFTSHILSDVERICDRVAILHKGKVTSAGRLTELLETGVHRVEIEVECTVAALEGLSDREQVLIRAVPSANDRHVVRLQDRSLVPEILRALLDRGATVLAVTPHRQRLEELFVAGDAVSRE